jgi:hypothetical protein
VLKTWIIQENDHHAKRVNGIQVTIARSLTTEEFKEHSGQWIPSISQFVGEGTLRHMIPTTSSSNNARERKLRTKFSLRGEDCNIPGLEVIK